MQQQELKVLCTLLNEYVSPTEPKFKLSSVRDYDLPRPPERRKQKNARWTEQ